MKSKVTLTPEEEVRNRKFRILARAGLLYGAPEFVYRGVTFNKKVK